MSFNNYKNISDVLKEYLIAYQEEDFLLAKEIKISNYFRDELNFFLKESVVYNSEYAICENIIAPILKEIWKSYKDEFILWSHQPLNYNEKLSEIPDYILAKKFPRAKIVFDKPYLTVIEAEKDNFEEGWGQCFAAMLAIQKINNDLNQRIFGIVTNGDIWQFGKLTLDVFTKNVKSYSIANLDELFLAINYIFEQCKTQLKCLII